MPSREHRAGCESFLREPWPWLTSTLSRSAAKQNSWLKELEIKRQVAGHMARGRWWNETCQTPGGFHQCLPMCPHAKAHSAEGTSWRKSDDFWLLSGFIHRPREYNGPHTYRYDQDISYGTSTLSLFMEINSFFKIKKISHLCKNLEYLKSQKKTKTKNESPKNILILHVIGSLFFFLICHMYVYCPTVKLSFQ